MAWADVPAKLTKYDALKYAQDDAAEKLVRFFTNGKSSDHEDVAENLRDAFEEQLDYNIGACENLEASKAVRPK